MSACQVSHKAHIALNNQRTRKDKARMINKQIGIKTRKAEEIMAKISRPPTPPSSLMLRFSSSCFFFDFLKKSCLFCLILTPSQLFRVFYTLVIKLRRFLLHLGKLEEILAVLVDLLLLCKVAGNEVTGLDLNKRRRNSLTLVTSHKAP